MSTEWVAGNARAKAMLNRRLGAGRTRTIAAMGSLAEAQHALVDTAYGRGVAVGQTLAETEHAVTAVPLWHLRVLAGWQPREGAQAIRSLAAGFEAANIAAHARLLAGAPAEPLFTLGALATAWSRLRETSSLTQLRQALSQSAWGDSRRRITAGHRAWSPGRLGPPRCDHGSGDIGLGVRRLGSARCSPAPAGAACTTPTRGGSRGSHPRHSGFGRQRFGVVFASGPCPGRLGAVRRHGCGGHVARRGRVVVAAGT